MKRYKDYFDLSFKQLLELRTREKAIGVKVYVAEDLEDLTKNFNQVTHSRTGVIEILLLKNLMCSLHNHREHDDTRRVNMELFGLSMLDYKYIHSYVSLEFSQYPYNRFHRLGVNPKIAHKLFYDSNPNGTIYIQNSRYYHFIDQELPELVGYDFEMMVKQKIRNKGKVGSRNFQPI